MSKNIGYEAIVARLLAFLRNKIADPAGRGTDTQEALIGDGTDTLTLSNKAIRNVRNVTVNGAQKIEFKDYTLIKDDPSDPTSFPKIVFVDAPPSDSTIIVDYHYGQTWIYPGTVEEGYRSPRITITHISTREEESGLGDLVDASNKGVFNYSWYQFDIWVKKGDSHLINGVYYSGGKLVDKLADDIIVALHSNKRYLREQGIEKIIMRMARDIGYSDMLKSWRKLLDFEFLYKTTW